MVEVLRADPASYGLVTGVGMHMTHHGASLWSTTPGAFAPPEPLGPLPTTPVVGGVEGPARVATFSTVHNRRGPEWSAVICELPDGIRCYAKLEEPVPDDVDLVGEPVTLEPGARGVNTAHR
jgi:acetyl-CoA C-acetyltransferase